MIQRDFRLIIHTNKKFRELFHRLGKDDCLVGRLNLKNCEESVFLDLVERGITLIPSALSQQLSRSKCLQACVYKNLMVPGTAVIRCRHDMISCIEKFSAKSERMITKQDRLDCGLGINCWNNIEDIYNAVCFGNLEFPFVLQPFVEDSLDIRVIIIDDYMEAYWRHASYSFRNNLHFGGQSGEHKPSAIQRDICQKAMKRGKFPYAHVDIMLTPGGDSFLAEINLSGGIRGAKITPAEYRKRIHATHHKLVHDMSDIDLSATN